MMTLLSKDLRLSCDALRPWAVGCAGLLALLLLLPLAPREIVAGVVGRSAAHLAYQNALGSLGDAIAVTLIPVAIFVAAAVGMGDRLHGARHLASVLPVRPVSRAVARLLALALALGVPLVAALLCTSVERTADATAILRDEVWRWIWPTLGVTSAGAGLLLSRLPLARWQVVVLGCGFLVVGGIVGAVAGRLFLPWTAPLIADAVARESRAPALVSTVDPSVQDLLATASLLGAIGSAAAVGVAAWCISIVATLRERRVPTRSERQRRAVVAGAMLVTASVVGGAVAGAAGARASDAVWRLDGFGERFVAGLSGEELVAWLDRDMAVNSPRAGGWFSNAMLRQDGGAFFIVRAALAEIGRLPEAQRLSHPLLLRLHTYLRSESPLDRRWAEAHVPWWDPMEVTILAQRAESSPDELNHWYLLFMKLRGGSVPTREDGTIDDAMAVVAHALLPIVRAHAAGSAQPSDLASDVTPNGTPDPPPLPIAIDERGREALRRLLPILESIAGGHGAPEATPSPSPAPSLPAGSSAASPAGAPSRARLAARRGGPRRGVETRPSPFSEAS